MWRKRPATQLAGEFKHLSDLAADLSSGYEVGGSHQWPSEMRQMGHCSPG